MALRSPVYLDLNTLLALAQYHRIDVPVAMDVVMRSSRSRELGASAAPSGVGLKAGGSKNVEYQSSYSLTPQQKAVASQAIDGLQKARVLAADDELSKDSLVEMSGEAVMTACSVAAKAFFIIRDGLKREANLDTIAALKSMPPEVWQSAKSVYIDNRPVPLPLLLELKNPQTPARPRPHRRKIQPPIPFTGRVLISLKPDFFVDVAAIDRVKDSKTILGQVPLLVPDDDYQQTDEWLLSGWEWMTRRILMTQTGDVIKTLVEKLDIPVNDESVCEYISGPAIVVDAVAVY